MAYERINWQNEPSEATALNDVNLNKMDSAIYDHDQRLDTAEGNISSQGSAITALQSGKVDKETNYGLSCARYIEVGGVVNTGKVIGGVSILDQSGHDRLVQIRNGVVIDSALSDSSENPVQNKVVKSALDGKVDKESGKGLSTISALGVTAIATDGDTIADIIAIDQSGTTYHNPIKNGVVVDSALSDSSENPVQNKVISEAFRDILPEETVTGNPITITDGSDIVPASECKVTMNPIQDLHGYDSPWIDSNEINRDPYLFRAVRGTANRIGNSLYDTLVGGTVAFNQLVDSGTSSVTLTTNHKALTKVNGAWSVVNGGAIAVTGGTDMVIDLTQMFGSTIADYIYSLEQATAGSGVAYFRSLFPKDYYDYNAGQLMSVNALSHKMVGFNQFDKSKATDGKKRSAITGAIQNNVWWYMSDYIRVFPNTVYYTNADGTGNDYPITLYDSEKNYIGFITGNAGPRTFNTGNATYIVLSSMTAKTNVDDLVLNLHWDGERDGEYEAYSEHIYPLDSDLELRGIPKLDANNNLYYDGDTYESDGTVTRRYGFRAYQSGDESLADAITDGTNTVYKLTTPTTETADTFENPQLVDNWGTEEYTDSRTIQIPVGHETYQANICEISGWDSLHLYQDTEQTETPETTHTATFPSTVYGGEYEFVSGEGKSEWGHIASYNGETLPSIWLSDRDVYAPNTSPTTGAEVVYKLATPTTLTNTPEDITLLKGVNVVSTDGDSLELKYSADIKAYIDNKLAQMLPTLMS